MTADIRTGEQPDYLWDGSGQPDPEVQRLESLLGSYRHKDRAAELPAPVIRRFSRRAFLLAAAAVALVTTVGWWALTVPRGPSWEVLAVAGGPTVADRAIGSSGRIHEGQLLETDATSVAELRVADIGRVTVDPGSSVRLIRTARDEHRLALDRGRIEAVITAPPRLFFVDTPSAVAIDYGCKYTLAVDQTGAGNLEVSLGWVMLEAAGRQSQVPMGAACRTRTGAGPGTPYFVTASDRLKAELARYDFEAGADVALDAVLAEATPRDSLTLWHLLARATAPQRARVYDRLAQLTPPPNGVTAQGIATLDASQLTTWWDSIRRTW